MQKFFDNVADPQGNVIPRAMVTVKDAVSGSPSTIYSDNIGTAKTNPITCDDQGYFEFYAANGRYTLTVTGGALTTRVVKDVLLEDITGTGADLVGFTPAGTGAVVRTSQDKMRRVIHASDYCVLDGVTDDAAQLQRVSDMARSVGLPLYLDGVALIKSQVALAGQIIGRPGFSRIKVASDFVFPAGTDPYNKSAIVTPNKALAYNDTTADVFYMNGVDLEWAYTAGAVVNPSLLVLTNIKSGAIENCRGFTPAGGWRCDALIDLYAVVKNFTLRKVDLRNLTALSAGGACWVRNITSDGSDANNVTENILIDQCFFGTTTGDEALAVYGVHGVTKNVKITGKTKISSLTSAQTHGTLASTFPLNDLSGNGVYAAVANVTWDDCDFFSDNFTDHVLRFGRTEDASNTTERVRAINCRFHARQSAVRTSYVVRNIPGLVGGCDLVNCQIKTTGTTQPITYGVRGFDRADGNTIVGTFDKAVEDCTQVQSNPSILSDSGVAARNCRQVSGNNLTAATNGVLCEGTDNYSVQDNNITLTATSGALTGVKINTVLGSSPTAEVISNRFTLNNASAVCVDTTTVPSSARVIANRSFGTGGKTSGTLAEQVYNDWYGVPEGPAVPVVTAMTDANLTLSAAFYQVVLLDVPLTADRTVTMPSTGAANGQRVDFIRTSNATGASNLIVASSPGKSIAVGGHAHAVRASSLWKAA